MQLTSSLPPVTPTPSYEGMKLGVVTIPSTGRTWQVNAGKVVGLESGYATVADAVAGVRQLTAGIASSAAIMDAGGRFFGVAMKFNYDSSSFNLDFTRHRAITEVNQNVRAIVEGGTVVYAPTNGGTISFPRPA